MELVGYKIFELLDVGKSLGRLGVQGFFEKTDDIGQETLVRRGNVLGETDVGEFGVKIFLG